MDGWNIGFLFRLPIFRCYVSSREGIIGFETTELGQMKEGGSLGWMGMLGKMKRPWMSNQRPQDAPRNLKKLGRLAHGFGGVMASGGGRENWMDEIGLPRS